MHDIEALRGQHGIGDGAEQRQLPTDRPLGHHPVGASRVPCQHEVGRQIQDDRNGSRAVSAGTPQQGRPCRRREARGVDDRGLPRGEARLESAM